MDDNGANPIKESTSGQEKRREKSVFIWGQDLHVWQWLAEPACLTVGQFTESLDGYR